MDYYEDDFYEPSEFDMLVDEWKEKLRDSVKEEYKAEMAKLRQENETLQDIKKNWDKKVRELQTEKEEVVRTKYRIEREIKNQYLSEILKDVMEERWGISYRWEYLREKCDRCDDDRRLHYKTPLGRDAYEMCSCAKQCRIYSPEEISGIQISQRRSRYDKDIKIFFEHEDNKDRDSYDTYRWHSDSFIFQDDMSYDELEKAHTHYAIFKNKEECQKYCDWLNAREREKTLNE